MKRPNFYYNQKTMFLVILNEQLQPVIGYSGKIAQRKYNEMTQKTKSIKDIKDEMEVCRSVLLNRSDDTPAEIISDYQKRYRELKKQLELKENEQIKNIRK